MSRLGRHLGQGGRVDDGGPHLGQLALGKRVVGSEQEVGHHQAEDGVAQELEALVGLRAGRLGAPRAVGDRSCEQLGVAERPAQTLREGVELGTECQGYEASSLATT